MLSNLPPGVTDAMIEDQAGEDLGTCHGNNCGDDAVDFGPDGEPYCRDCMRQFPVEADAELYQPQLPFPEDEPLESGECAGCVQHEWVVDRSWPEDPVVLCGRCGKLK